MSYRDDDNARKARLEALERQAERSRLLEQRVRELEEENRRLRSAIAHEGAPAKDDNLAKKHEGIYVAEALRTYLAALVEATHQPTSAEIGRYIASGIGVRHLDSMMTEAKQLAVREAREFVTPGDVKQVAAEHMSQHLILSEKAEADGVSASALIARIIDATEVP
jgi:MoxR-like ATPase